MNRDHIFLSTIAPDAHTVARQSHLGLEIAEYCTAWNMDDQFPQTDAAVRQKLEGIRRQTLHAPFNELFPCAIDPKARELARFRFRQAIDLAKAYGADKVVIHGGCNPKIYYPIWYTEQSIRFWLEFLRDDPGVLIVLENVLEETPDMLLEIVRGADDPRLRLCLDVGHVNAYSGIGVMDWLEQWAPYLSHFHIHNNDGSWDTHNAPGSGSIPMEELLNRAEKLCPDATYTLEVPEAAPAVRWLRDHQII